jgi:Cu/Ag efflux protein CusF
MKFTFQAVLAAALIAMPSLSQAQQVAKANAVTAVATIQAIDSTTRSVTLKNEKGEEDTFQIGPEVKRFDEFKVGDKVRMTYYESLVFQLRKPGETSNPTGTAGAAGRAAAGNLPAGAVAKEMKTTVTVKAIDPQLPSITVTTQDGRTVTRKIEDKKNLEGVKVGDRIDITYTQALIANLERAN